LWFPISGTNNVSDMGNPGSLASQRKASSVKFADDYDNSRSNSFLT
jgi:hypothetical protein